jgi:hypothetical protein
VQIEYLYNEKQFLSFLDFYNWEVIIRLLIRGWVWWLKPIILVTWEAEIRRIFDLRSAWAKSS